MNQGSPKFDVPISKGKTLLMILGALAFVACGIWLWNLEDTDTRHYPGYVKVVSVACIGFFGFCASIGAVKLLDRRPGLSLDEEGITDNSSGFSAGRIKWKDIEGIDTTKIKSTRLLLIFVKDPQAYLSKMNPIKKMMMTLSIRMYGTPFCISSNSLSCDYDTLVSLIESRINKTSSQQLH